MRYSFACVRVSSKCVCKGSVKAIFFMKLQTHMWKWQGVSKCEWVAFVKLNLNMCLVSMCGGKKSEFVLEKRKPLQEKLKKNTANNQNNNCLCSSQFRKFFLKLKCPKVFINFWLRLSFPTPSWQTNRNQKQNLLRLELKSGLKCKDRKRKLNKVQITTQKRFGFKDTHTQKD